KGPGPFISGWAADAGLWAISLEGGDRKAGSLNLKGRGPFRFRKAGSLNLKGPGPFRFPLDSGDAGARGGVAVRAEDEDSSVGFDRAEDEDLRAHRADLARREVHDGDDERALELRARVVGDPRRRALDADLGAEVDAQLPGRLARLRELLDLD